MRSRGDVIKVKVLGIMALIDEGNCFVFVNDHHFSHKYISNNFIICN